MLDELVPLEPVHFFALQCDCYYLKKKQFEKKHLLPNLASFYEERSLAVVSIGWNEKGIALLITINGRFNEPDFPNFLAADSVELFFDTRDVKTTGYSTRFCHHFYFLPDPVQVDGNLVQAGEITRFRTDEVHELCDPDLLSIETSEDKRSRSMHIFIPSECLYGYDSNQFDRLGFTYRINRRNGARQFFSASSADFQIEAQPSLWASLKLIKEK